MDELKLANRKPRKHVEIAPISSEERILITEAVRLLNTRRPEFYRRAIIEKAQSVLNDSRKEASLVREQPRLDGASFASGEEKR